jgi:hypothetical protein
MDTFFCVFAFRTPGAKILVAQFDWMRHIALLKFFWGTKFSLQHREEDPIYRIRIRAVESRSFWFAVKKKFSIKLRQTIPICFLSLSQNLTNLRQTILWKMLHLMKIVTLLKNGPFWRKNYVFVNIFKNVILLVTPHKLPYFCEERT